MSSEDKIQTLTLLKTTGGKSATDMSRVKAWIRVRNVERTSEWYSNLSQDLVEVFEKLCGGGGDNGGGGGCGGQWWWVVASVNLM